MKIILQRVSQASVRVDDKIIHTIGRGYVALIGIHKGDTSACIPKMVQKIAQLRVFSRDEKERSIQDINGDILLISQFTLYANCKKGNRPSFSHAATSEIAEPIYQELHTQLECKLGKKVGTGVFGANMQVELINDGPVTIVLDSQEI